MNVYTHCEFRGHYPVGTSAVVVAQNKVAAAPLLEAQLIKEGLNQPINPDDFEEIDLNNKRAYVLINGDY